MCFVESKRGAVYPYDSRCTMRNRSYCSFLIVGKNKVSCVNYKFKHFLIVIGKFLVSIM